MVASGYSGSTASPSMPRSHALWTFVTRLANSVGVSSSRLSKTRIRPLFSATKTAPFGANAIALGRVRPSHMSSSLKPSGIVGPAAATSGTPTANDIVPDSNSMTRSPAMRLVQRRAQCDPPSIRE